jgi:hypothetical protein
MRVIVFGSLFLFAILLGWVVGYHNAMTDNAKKKNLKEEVEE